MPSGEDGTAGQVAGRRSVINKYSEVGEHSYCSVATAHIPFEEIEGEDAVEVASVFVRMPAGRVEAGCAAATAVAGPELPEA